MYKTIKALRLSITVKLFLIYLLFSFNTFGNNTVTKNENNNFFNKACYVYNKYFPKYKIVLPNIFPYIYYILKNKNDGIWRFVPKFSIIIFLEKLRLFFIEICYHNYIDFYFYGSKKLINNNERKERKERNRNEIHTLNNLDTNNNQEITEQIDENEKIKYKKVISFRLGLSFNNFLNYIIKKASNLSYFEIMLEFPIRFDGNWCWNIYNKIESNFKGDGVLSDGNRKFNFEKLKFWLKNINVVFVPIVFKFRIFKSRLTLFKFNYSDLILILDKKNNKIKTIKTCFIKGLSLDFIFPKISEVIEKMLEYI